MARRQHVQVRWLGAFRRHRNGRGKLSSIVSSARWELAASARGEERAWALTADRGFKPVGGARIGLLVSPETSLIKRVTVGDGYSARVGGRTVALGGYRTITRPPSARSAMGGARLDRPWQDYDEVTGVPHLVAVVVHPGANKRVRAWAKQVADAIGLPYVGDTKAAAKWLRERRRKM